MNKTGEPQLRPRGPKPGLIGGNALEFRKNMVAFYQRNQREFGDVAFYRLLNLPFYQLSHPADIKEVLLTQAHKVQKSPIYKQMLSKYLGNGLLISDGEVWKRQRKRTQPSFHHVRIHAYADTMVESTAQAIADWQERGAVDIYDEMTRLTLQIVVQTLFHVDVREQATEIGELTRVLQEAVIGEVSTPLRLPDWVPTPALRRKRHSIQRLDEIVYGIINDRLQTGEDRGDLLSMMLLTEDDNGNRMTPQEARDEALTIFIAGHDTTANALTWTWVLLSQHPAVGAKLDAELDRVLGDRLPTLEDLPALTYSSLNAGRFAIALCKLQDNAPLL
ncbi:MAG: cytochrome P450 [Caldilineaceae bacterium]|nr:cytochrome P450 [Caldilineaceae bacterium]